jgi:hypothetical protein
MGSWSPNNEVVDALRAAVESAVIQTAENIETTAKSLAPVRRVSKSEKSSRRRIGSARAAELSSGFAAKGLSFGGTANFRKRSFSVSENAWTRPLKERKSALAASESSRSFTIRSAMVSGKLRVEAGELPKGLLYTGRREMEQAQSAVAGGLHRGFTPKENDWVRTSAGRTPSARVTGRTTDTKGITTFTMSVGGYLKAHIKAGNPKWSGNRITVTITSHAPYSRYVEFPTRRTKAQPFLMPALKQSRSAFLRAIRGKIGG